MDYKELKKKYGFSNSDISVIFGYKTYVSYRNLGKKKKQIEDAVVLLHKLFTEQKS